MFEYLAGLPTPIPLYIIAALLVFTPIVFIHELGHFLVARWCGIKVDVFSVGFGKELFGFYDRRGTRWRLSAVPLGGYVKFTGDENVSSMPDQELLDTIPADERKDLFYFSALWKRVAVVLAGPVANFILAIVILASILGSFGRPELAPLVSVVQENSPAERAGVLAGDLIVEIDGRKMDTFTDVRRVVSLSTGDELTIIVERNGEQVSLLATPERRETPDGLGGTQKTGMLGIVGGGEGSQYILREFGPLEAVGEAVEETFAIVEGTLKYLGRIVIGRESADQLSGPLGIAKMSADVAERGGALSLVQFAAILSVSIGLLNLFPIPMLDGGHLVFYAFEAIARRPLDAKTQEMAFRFGFAVIILLFLFVTYNDISSRFMTS